jgi:hypothetical protein
MTIHTGEKGTALNLVASSMSPDGRFVACSDPLALRVYRVEAAPTKTHLDMLKVRRVGETTLSSSMAASLAASSLCFSLDSRRLLVAGLDATVRYVIQL